MKELSTEELLQIAEIKAERIEGYDPRITDVENFLKHFKIGTTQSDSVTFRIPCRVLWKLYIETYKIQVNSHYMAVNQNQFYKEIALVLNHSKERKTSCYLVKRGPGLQILKQISDPYFDRIKKKRSRSQYLRNKRRIKALTPGLQNAIKFREKIKRKEKFDQRYLKQNLESWAEKKRIYLEKQKAKAGKS